MNIEQRDSKISDKDWQRLQEINGTPLWKMSERELNNAYNYVYEFTKQDALECRCQICALCSSILMHIGKNGSLKSWIRSRRVLSGAKQ